MNQIPSTKQPVSNQPLNPSAIVAMIVFVFIVGWVAFAYYKGAGAKDAAGGSILLLHPIVAILLIFLLFRLRDLIAVPSVINVLLVMIIIWLFKSLLGVLMPFILGFGIAYFFRFLLNAMQDIPLPRGRRLQLSRKMARTVLTALTLGAFALLFLYIIPQIVNQSKEMSRGLVKFYQQTIVPFSVGNVFHAVTIHPNNPDVVYIGMARGIYRLELSKDKVVGEENIASGELIGQTIQTIAAVIGGKYQLYAGTAQGLYARPNSSQKEKDQNVWKRIGGESFADKSVQAIAIPSWNPTQFYVGTDDGLYRSVNQGTTWERIEIDPSSATSLFVRSMACSSGSTRMIYVDSNQGVYRSADDGETWSSVPLENLEPTSIQALTFAALDGNERLYAGTSKGLYRWEGEGNWREIGTSAQLPGSISLLASLPQRMLYVGNSAVLYRSTDPEAGWSLVVEAEGGILSQIKGVGGEQIVDNLREYLTTKLPTLARTGRDFIGTIVRSFSSIAIGFGGFVVTGFLAFIVFIYASQSLSHYVQSFVNLVPEESRDTIRLYLTEIDQNLQSFLRGQATVILIISLISITVYSIIGVPFALVVGLLAGLCNAIPNFGPYIGGAFAVLSMLMGFAAGHFDMVGFLIRIALLLGAMIGIQMIDNSFVSPRVMSSAVDVDPLLIMLAVFVGASALGFWGVLLAIPFIVIIKSIITVSKQIRAEETS